MNSLERPVVAFGPEAPAFGSWEWVGADIAQALSGGFETITFRDAVPDCDVCVFIKFKPPLAALRVLSERCRIVYAPVDLYGSAAEIDADGESLRLCSAVVVHCERLEHYFAPYSTTTYLDHHLKFIAPLREERTAAGPILWIGNHSNLPPLVAWLNTHPLPDELWILTDLDEQPGSRLGITSHPRVRVGRWNPERHIEWTALARAAIDIKGDDFRARHKPPTKALDFIASGLPLAMSTGSSSGEYLWRHHGLPLPDPTQTETWLGSEYWAQCQCVAQQLRATLTLTDVATRWSKLLQALIDSARP